VNAALTVYLHFEERFVFLEALFSLKEAVVRHSCRNGFPPFSLISETLSDSVADAENFRPTFSNWYE